MKCVVYKIENIVNRKCYIGSSTNYSRRKRRHLENLKALNHHSKILQKAWIKYGEDSFRFLELESFYFIDKSHLLSKEQYYLDLIKPEYNVCKIAGSQLGLKRSDEFKKKCAERMIGKPSWNKGIKTGSQSKETKDKRSNSMKGKKHSDETKNKMSSKATGRIFSDEHKNKLSKAKIKHGKYCRK